MPKTPRLRALRDRAALSQEELHARSGVSRATIADLEAGNRGAQPRTIRKLAEALNVAPDDLYGDPERPLGEAPPSQQLTLNGELEEERRLRYLRAWRAFVHSLARRWEHDLPKTSTEISPLFEAMTALVEQRVFEPSDASVAEAHELMLLMVGFQRLNDIADKVEKDEEAEQRRATFALIQEKASA